MDENTQKGHYNEELQRKVITLVRNEVNQWEDATVFVTDRVSFHMRNVIKMCRKNFWGIFEKPRDPNDGRAKIWVPLTESVVDTVVKNIDLDTKDINLRAKKVSSIAFTSIVRQKLLNMLEQMNFGQLLDDMEQNLAVDGTVVWKTYEVKKDGKYIPVVVPVDILNAYIDPNAPSIAESDFIERALLTPDQIENMNGWYDTKDLNYTNNLNRSDRNLRAAAAVVQNTTPLRDVYERWGVIRKSWITGKESDENDWVDAHIVVSGLENDPRLHLIEENRDRDLVGNIKKPYEEVWYKRMLNRWHGRGVAEKLMWLQLWINEIVNIRINRSRVSQLGIWKVRSGSNISQGVLSRLVTNGVIKVDQMDDIEQLVVQDASPASYQDENIVNNWAQRVTSAFESATGEMMPSSTPATNAVISSRGAQSEFGKVKEQIGFFLQRWITRQIFPILMKNLTPGEIVATTGDIKDLMEMDEYVVNYMLVQTLDEMNKNGKLFDVEQAKREKERLLKKLRAQGDQRFYKLKDKIDPSEYDVKVQITNEDIDKAVLAQNLTAVFQTVASAPQSGIPPQMVLEQLYDIMGLDVSQFKGNSGMMTVQQFMEQNQGQAAPQALMQQLMGQMGAAPQTSPTATPAPVPSPATPQIEATTM